jgi:hypothetical protein
MCATIGLLTWAVVRLHLSNPKLWIGLAILLAGSMAALISSRYPRRVRLGRFDGRERLSDEQLFDRYFKMLGVPKETVLNEWRQVAKCLGVPAGLMRPTDRFDTELYPVPGWHFYDDDLEILFAQTARRLQLPIDQLVAKVKTLDDYIRLTATPAHNQ